MAPAQIIFHSKWINSKAFSEWVTCHLQKYYNDLQYTNDALCITGMVVAYSIMGGFLFQALEAPYEYRMKLGIKQWKEEKITEIWQLSSQLNTGMMENSNFTAAVRRIFLDFQERVTVAVKDKVEISPKSSGSNHISNVNRTRILQILQELSYAKFSMYRPCMTAALSIKKSLNQPGDSLL